MTEMDTVIAIAQEAGKILLKYFKKDIPVDFKRDKFDPVTQADREADQFIRRSLQEAFPNDAILSEESSVRPTFQEQRVWVADPLDGTKHFVAGYDCFSTIIGLLEDGKPKLGVVNIPARETLYYAEKGKGAFRIQDTENTKIHVSDIHEIEKSRLLTRNVLNGEVRPIEQKTNQLHFKERYEEGSIGTKVSLVADGSAEAFIHTVGSSKWDTLGAQVILEEAGGILSDIDGNTLDYSQVSVTWENYLLAVNGTQLQKQVLNELRSLQ